ncbi:MAG: hypothetical protein ACJ8GN_15435 [Longimicrobiaceae bacterium]
MRPFVHPFRTVAGTRLLLARVPPLLADIVRDALAGEAEVERVDPAGGLDRLSERVARTGAQVLLAEGGEAPIPNDLLELMYRHPRLKLLLLSADGRTAALWRLVPDRHALAAATPRALAEAVRAATAG